MHLGDNTPLAVLAVEGIIAESKRSSSVQSLITLLNSLIYQPIINLSSFTLFDGFSYNGVQQDRNNSRENDLSHKIEQIMTVTSLPTIV